MKMNEFLKDEIKITELLNYALINGNPSFKTSTSPWIDTLELSKEISKYLQDFGVNEEIFAKKVLNSSKESLVKLLATPAIKWENCREATREGFIKMKEFLDNPSLFDFDEDKEDLVMMNGGGGIHFYDFNNDESIEEEEEEETEETINLVIEEQGEEEEEAEEEEESTILSFLKTFNNNQSTPTILSDINFDDLRLKVQKFLHQYQLTTTFVAEKLLNISKRSFMRLINNQINLNNCKLTTKDNLLKLCSFLNDENQINNFLIENKYTPPQPPVTPSSSLVVPPLIVSANKSTVIMNETIHRDLANRVRKFLADNRVNPKEFARVMFGISLRAFNRLLSKPSFNWANCKPVTKQRLLKLKTMMDDEARLIESLNSGVRFKTEVDVVEDEDEEDEDEDEQPQQQQQQELSFSVDSQNPIDLQDLSKQIYKFLKDHQLSQRIFADKLLGVTKTHFNKLISKPQLWSNCKLVTRRHYLTLYEFLNDKKRHDEFLNDISNERKHPILTTNLLDTVMLSRNLKSLLQNNKILNRDYLLKFLSVGSFNELQSYLNTSIDWSRCREKGNEKYLNFYIKLNNYLNSISLNETKEEEEEEEEDEEDDDDDEDLIMIN